MQVIVIVVVVDDVIIFVDKAGGPNLLGASNVHAYVVCVEHQCIAKVPKLHATVAKYFDIRYIRTMGANLASNRFESLRFASTLQSSTITN